MRLHNHAKHPINGPPLIKYMLVNHELMVSSPGGGGRIKTLIALTAH